MGIPLFAAFTSRAGRALGKLDLPVLVIELLEDIHEFSSVDFSFSPFLLCSEFSLHHCFPLRSLGLIGMQGLFGQRPRRR